MPLRNKTPGEGGSVRCFHNKHLKTRNGEKWYAHLAGKVCWIECHTVGYSKPCLYWISYGELVCKKCHPLDPKETLGYVPVWREKEGAPGFVVVKDYSRDIVERIKVHDRLLISRGYEESDALSVVPADGGKRYHSTRPDFMAHVDLTPSLLRIWKIPELTEWYYRTQCASPPPPELPKGTALKDDGRPYKPEYQAAAKRWGADVILDQIGTGGEQQLSNEDFAKQVKASANGNGKHTKPKG